jgi:hypothetical protein
MRITKARRLIGNNRGSTFLENLLIILIVISVIALSAYGLALALSDNIVAVIERVNRIGTP